MALLLLVSAQCRVMIIELAVTVSRVGKMIAISLVSGVLLAEYAPDHLLMGNKHITGMLGWPTGTRRDIRQRQAGLQQHAPAHGGTLQTVHRR